MQKKIKKILNYYYYEAWNGIKGEKNEEIGGKIDKLYHLKLAKFRKRITKARESVIKHKAGPLEFDYGRRKGMIDAYEYVLFLLDDLI